MDEQETANCVTLYVVILLEDVIVNFKNIIMHTLTVYVSK